MTFHFEENDGWKEFMKSSHRKPKEDCSRVKTAGLYKKVRYQAIPMHLGQAFVCTVVTDIINISDETISQIPPKQLFLLTGKSCHTNVSFSCVPNDLTTIKSS
ncbi:unnamed protein product [Protopolystoma xenopodis]|uniref:Uncharacterized protein n=1 Tax=Protopolystoma xenopodis TaxID=117903 RepID=A0A3S5ABC8_9PLAT|nr:unnamed protein product [Protopolystoma xenopodis]